MNRSESTSQNPLQRLPPVPDWNGRAAVCAWDYHNENGEVLFRIARYCGDDGEKDIRPWHPDENGNWKMELPEFPPGTRPLLELPGLLEATPKDTVYVGEGEKVAAALLALGLYATTSSGGSNAAAQSDWSPLERFQRVVILPDRDEPGEKYAADVVKLLAALQGSRRVDIARLPGIPEAGDVVDWIQELCQDWDGLSPLPEDCRDHLCGELWAVIDAIAEPAPLPEVEGDGDWPEPIPLSKPVEGSEDFPVEHLGPILTSAAQTLHNDVPAPMAMVAGSLLSASALAAQAHANVHMPDGRKIPLSLFVLSIAESGDRKSSADRIVLSMHDRWQHDAFDVWREELRRYEIDFGAWDRDRKRAANIKDRKKSVEAMKEVGPEPIRPPCPVLLVENATTEGIIRSLTNDYPTTGLFNDEGGMFLGGYSMKENELLATISSFCKLWDGRAVGARVRGGDATQAAAYGRRFSLHLMAQPDPVRDLLGNEMAHGQGFLPRFLISWPQTMRGTRMYKPCNPAYNPALKTYFSRIVALLTRQLPMDPETRELKPRPLTMSAEAMGLYVVFVDAVEVENAPGAVLDVVSAWAAKAGEHALRLAGVLTLLDDPNATIITGDRMANGIGLATYYLSEMLRLRSEAAIPREVVDAQKLFRWMQKTGKTQLSKHEIMHKGPTRAVTKLNPLLALLEQNHWIRLVPPVKAPGRPAQTWSINPNAA